MRRGPLSARLERRARAGPVVAGPAPRSAGYDRPSDAPAPPSDPAPRRSRRGLRRRRRQRQRERRRERGDDECRRLQDGRGAGGREAQRSEADDEARPVEAIRTHAAHELRQLHDRARPEGRARDERVARVARAPRLLRPHGLPSDRARVRDPGRRPDRLGLGRSGLPDRRQACSVGPLHAWSGRDGEDAGRAGWNERQPVLRRDSERRGPPSRLHGRGEGHEGAGRRRPDRPPRRPRRAADAARRDREGDRRGELMTGAVILAAGAATRYGGPKQRVFLPRVLERLRAAPVDEIVVVAGAYELETDVRVVTCAEWERGPGASLRCGLRALPAEATHAVVVLADGPDLDPRAVTRVLDHRHEAAAVAATYGGV